MRESRIENALVRGVKRAGGGVRKLAWPGRRGAPDRVVFWGNGVLDFAELKAPRKKAAAHQAREHRRLRRLGFRVHVIDTIEKVNRFVATCGERFRESSA